MPKLTSTPLVNPVGGLIQAANGISAGQQEVVAARSCRRVLVQQAEMTFVELEGVKHTELFNLARGLAGPG